MNTLNYDNLQLLGSYTAATFHNRKNTAVYYHLRDNAGELCKIVLGKLNRRVK